MAIVVEAAASVLATSGEDDATGFVVLAVEVCAPGTRYHNAATSAGSSYCNWSRKALQERRPILTGGGKECVGSAPGALISRVTRRPYCSV